MMLILRAALLLPWTAFTLRTRDVHAVVIRAMRVRTPVRTDVPRALAIAAATHRAARIWRSSCLTRSVVIARLLAAESLEARLTLAVARAPFAAHACLLHGPRMLAGQDPARDYVPLCRIDAGVAPAFVAPS